ncbi:MAG: hypothetical protein AzoDbin1_05118 [Azoarcus sp.]|nr:hypothetical protein [Azoarcus sp.]
MELIPEAKRLWLRLNSLQWSMVCAAASSAALYGWQLLPPDRQAMLLSHMPWWVAFVPIAVRVAGDFVTRLRAQPALQQPKL